MSEATILALAGGIPTIIGAITALILALKGNSTAKTALAVTMAHVTSITAHPIAPSAPLPPTDPDKLN
jgi:hypothetical protein